MTQFPTAAHLVSWAKLRPRTVQSGPVTRGGKTGKGNPYLKGALGEAAAVAAKTDTFLGERYRRLLKHRGKLKLWSRSPVPSSSSSGTCSPTRLPASATSAPTITPAASTPNAGCVTTSPDSPQWATTSPSNPPHSQIHRLTT
ncbi:transposase [Rhodococcus sp. WAY2]|uniref:transposase n=1 Tax=Rhodococcus sp. ZPP TaxID=2749906 RepID=UPI002E2B4BE2|nr:transposase [Rhodococcus sp. WAY2]